ncbi:hypothetical protein WN982_22170 [Paraburkholderia sp. IMGN_8]
MRKCKLAGQLLALRGMLRGLATVVGVNEDVPRLHRLMPVNAGEA